MSSTQFDGDIDSFVSYLKSNRGLSVNTLKAYRADLTACLHLFELRGVTDLNEITLDDLRSWMAVESRDHARSSMARKTVAVRGFFAWAYEHGLSLIHILWRHISGNASRIGGRRGLRPLP